MAEPCSKNRSLKCGYVHWCLWSSVWGHSLQSPNPANSSHTIWRATVLPQVQKIWEAQDTCKKLVTPASPPDSRNPQKSLEDLGSHRAWDIPGIYLGCEVLGGLPADGGVHYMEKSWALLEPRAGAELPRSLGQCVKGVAHRGPQKQPSP